MRTATIKRKTKETDIEVSVNLDGTGVSNIATGIGFFDHMLDLLARHSRIDVAVKAVGDLHIDHHHTTEDVGIALGQAVKQALGTMAGITRYASIHMPMDETLSRVVIDISGRPVLVFKVEFPRDKVGTFDTELVREWFNAFAINAGVTLHVETLYGENSHHIAESCFKGLARALRAAVAIDVGMARLGAGGPAIFWADVLIALLTGFEASSIRRWTLSRRDWRQLDIVVARNWETAERRFFDRWTATQRVINDQTAVDRGAPPPTRDLPGQPFSRPPPLPRNEIIGLFPEPGTSR